MPSPIGGRGSLGSGARRPATPGVAFCAVDGPAPTEGDVSRTESDTTSPGALEPWMKSAASVCSFAKEPSRLGAGRCCSPERSSRGDRATGAGGSSWRADGAACNPVNPDRSSRGDRGAVTAGMAVILRPTGGGGATAAAGAACPVTTCVWPDAARGRFPVAPVPRKPSMNGAAESAPMLASSSSAERRVWLPAGTVSAAACSAGDTVGFPPGEVNRASNPVNEPG